MGILFPLSAPALIIVAGLTISIAAITTIFHLIRHWNETFVPKISAALEAEGIDPDRATPNQTWPMIIVALKRWAEAHKAQAFIVGVGIGLFITALILTIGFFTGGAAFAFMAPVFTAIAAPFVAFTTSFGLQLSIAALSGTTLILASLNITNIFHRLATWFDSFIYDYAAAKNTSKSFLNQGDGWAQIRKDEVAEKVFGNDGIGYFPAVISGMAATVGNSFRSPDEDRLEGPNMASRDYVDEHVLGIKK